MGEIQYIFLDTSSGREEGNNCADRNAKKDLNYDIFIDNLWQRRKVICSKKERVRYMAESWNRKECVSINSIQLIILAG